MKKNITSFMYSLLLLAAMLFSGCHDSEPGQDNGDSPITYNRYITSLLSCGELSGITITDGNIKSGGEGLSQPVLHYFGEQVQLSGLDKDAYRRAYENGESFIVSQENRERLYALTGHTQSAHWSPATDIQQPWKGMETKVESKFDMTDPESPKLESTDTVRTEINHLLAKPMTQILVINKSGEQVIILPADISNYHQTALSLDGFVRRFSGSTEKDKIKSGVDVTAQHQFFHRVSSVNVSGYTYSEAIDENFTITSVYSYTENRDYYMVEMEVILHNADMGGPRWYSWNYNGHNYWCLSGYLYGYETETTLQADGDNNTIHVMQPSPQTTTGSSSFTTGVSYNIGGNIGASPTGPSGGFSGGITISNSHTTSIPDVTVSNLFGHLDGSTSTDNRIARWKFTNAKPRSHSDYTNTGHHRWAVDTPPLISTTTAVYNTTWIWAIDHPAGSYQMAACNTGAVGMVGGCQSWVGEQWEIWYDDQCRLQPAPAATFTMFPPKRD